MDAAKAIEKLKAEKSNGDKEAAHANADAILCYLLIDLGYSDVVKAWEDVPKWYS